MALTPHAVSLLRKRGIEGLMKKLRIAFLFLTSFIILAAFKISPVKAEIVDIYGGIQNEYTYEEVVFITGKPIVFTGTSDDVKVTEKESKGKLTETYKITLEGPNGEKLTRNFTYVSDVTNYDQIGQSTANGEVTKYTEKIKIGNVTYELEDYQYSKGRITDKRPASDYFSGNVISRKTYVTNSKDDPETVVVNIESRSYGYENFWGATITQITDYEFQYDNGKIGYVQNKASTTKSRTLNYEENTPSLSSFDGGYAVISAANTISEYTYDLPKNSGNIDLDAEYMSRIERLIVPKFRDLSAHGAKDDIEKLYSLGILDDQSNFFSPNTPMQRYDFAIAIGKAVDLRVLEDKKSKKSTTSIFADVNRNEKDYNYLVTAVEKGIITGTEPNKFIPNGSLTRQQAATILVRALGLENKAPDPGYQTAYSDDAKISDYARDSVYVATELGLMSGSNGKFNPKGALTRAQASQIIMRFLEYLENDLQQNYRDDILFFQ